MRNRTLLSALVVLSMSIGMAGAQDLVINELYYDGPGADSGTFTEILGPGGLDLTGYMLVGVNGSNGEDYRVVDLQGMVIPADGYLVIAQDSSVVNFDYINSGVDWQNGPDEVEIRAEDDPIDGVCYGDAGGTLSCEGGTNAPDVSSGNSLSRCPDGVDTNDNAADFTETTTLTPGGENDCGIVGPVDMSVCEAIVLDEDGVAIHDGVLVHLTDACLILNNDGTYGVGRLDHGMTGGGCCIYLFDFDAYQELNEGDEIEVTGTIDFYNGKTEISGPGMEIIVLSSGNPLPDPEMISTEELALNGDDYESCLIGIDNLTIVGGDPWPPEGSSANIEVQDETGVPITLRVDSDTNIDGTDPPFEPFTCYGIGGQYDSSPPHDSGYQILPRYTDDIISTPPPVAVCCVEADCFLMTQEECDEAGGEWYEALDSCDPNPCGTATEQESWGSIKNMYR